MSEVSWSSPMGKFVGFGNQVSEELWRKPKSTDLNERHPFEVEICRIPPGLMQGRAICRFFGIPPIAGLAAMLLLFPSLVSIAGGAEEYAIYKSGDRGRAWFRSDTGIPRDSRINVFGSLNDLVFVGTDSGVFISRDVGKTWRPASGEAGSSGRIISIAAFKGRVFVGTAGNGLLMSLDSGRRWIPNATFPSMKVRCLLAHDGSLFAGTDDEAVFASEDGTVWTHLAQGFPAGGQVFAMAAAKGTLFAGLYSNGLYAWNRRESRWTRAGAVTPLALAPIGDVLIAGHNPGGIYWSGDLGSTWSKGTGSPSEEIQAVIPEDGEDLPTDAPVWDLASDGELVFGGASAGIYYSEDRGRTWTRARVGLPERSPGIAFYMNKEFVLAATEVGGGVTDRHRPESETNRFQASLHQPAHYPGAHSDGSNEAAQPKSRPKQ